MGDIRTEAPQCLTNEMMGMTPNTLVAFWFSGFKCNYVHEWDNVYCIICKYVSETYKKRMELMKLIINTNLYIFLFVSVL